MGLTSNRGGILSFVTNGLATLAINDAFTDRFNVDHEKGKRNQDLHYVIYYEGMKMANSTNFSLSTIKTPSEGNLAEKNRQ